MVESLGRMESLLREARLAAGLRHPAIVRVLDVSPPSEDWLYVVLEYIEGRTLADVLEGGQVTPRQLAEIVAAVADAVHYAHNAGLVHRDLKPSNILVDNHGWPFVSDFGLAVHEDVQQRRAGEIAGTPN